jgi:hypothetical protein
MAHFMTRKRLFAAIATLAVVFCNLARANVARYVGGGSIPQK